MQTHMRRHQHALHSETEGSVAPEGMTLRSCRCSMNNPTAKKNCEGQRASHGAQPTRAVVGGKEVRLLSC